MFRRKEESESMTGESTQGTLPNSNTQQTESVVAGVPGYAAAQAAVASRPTMAEAPKTPSMPSAPQAAPYRPAAPSAARAAAPSAQAQQNAAPASDKQQGKAGRRVLTVGNDILLKGEIATCDRLVIEGKVDATLKDVHTVELAQTGSFKGTAEVEDAEISGLFEGDLIVRNRLVIYSTGKVRGKIAYGEIEIERGGELTGEITTQASAGASTTKKAA